MKKTNILPLLLIGLGILAILSVTLLFHAYTHADNDVFNAAGDLVTAEGEILGDWRSNELTMYLGTQRIIIGIASGVVALGIVLFLIVGEKPIKSRNVIVLALIVAATATVIGFLTIFYPCYEMMAPARLRPMRCVWTMRVLFGILGAINVSGFLMLLYRRSKELVKGLNFAVVLLGIAFLLTPTTLTGVCVVHRCVDGFRPFALVMGGVMLALTLINVILLVIRKEDENETVDDISDSAE